ncbi:MAG: CRISPR-associated protein CasA/Cse1 [Candidatus Hydrogenedentes bacterium ADurb.Bin101]|nr:MAG: CRISPR-associated protein CasA/Cse1 [Candidatus Hydrogenedentes bacterium ADurb.Bin101]
MSEFNLIDEAWIPCIALDGTRVEYGIRDTLVKAHELREICDDSPLVTVALHRLLLAVLYRIHEGPGNFREWSALYSVGKFDQEKINAYLDRWSARFYLIDDTYPFYQMGGMEMNASVPVSRLASEFSSGNNATLFDHHNDETGVAFTYAQAVRWLLACQSFALGFGRSGNATTGGTAEERPYFADANALRGMTVWLQSNNLFQTLAINLVASRDASPPPWELEDPHAYRDRKVGKTKTMVEAKGIIDRLTWQSRLIRLLPEGDIISRMYFTQGRSADTGPGDPMKVYRISQREGIFPVSLSSNKAAWRDCHSILMIPGADNREKRPECLNLLSRAREEGVIEDELYLVNVVGLASAPGKAGKFLLWRQDRMPLPAEVLVNKNLIERIGVLIENAERLSLELNSRVRRMVKIFLCPTCEAPGGGQPDPDEVSRLANSIDARGTFWSRVEPHFYLLLEHLPGDWNADGNEWKTGEQQSATQAWRANIKREAQRALEESIRALGTTAKAIQAVARVRTTFGDNDLNPPQQETVKSKKDRKGSKKK